MSPLVKDNNDADEILSKPYDYLSIFSLDENFNYDRIKLTHTLEKDISYLWINFYVTMKTIIIVAYYYLSIQKIMME